MLAAVGATPLVELQRLVPGVGFQIFAKLESFNPGGSIKDRVAYSMLAPLIDSGRLVPGHSVVVESSSGNLGIGLALVCRYFGLRFICVVDALTTMQNLAVLRAFGAEVDLVTTLDPKTQSYLPTRLDRVQELCAQVPDAYWPNQYANPLNAQAHETTMDEIVSALDHDLDYLFCATSSCGTLHGCARYVRERGLSTTIVAVDALGSAIFGQARARRLIPGHGASIRPALFADGLADEIVHVSDLECVHGCRRLVRDESILAGGSSGAIVAALLRKAPHIADGARCVLILADRGDRYLDTIYDDEWVVENFGVDAALLLSDSRTEEYGAGFTGE
ncbi:2,3-diaminopropionate biosynthesis protein SbnA [Frankia sp. AiPa1]|uniref:2,3-diaminopropionate biosynthesis protein SbnA n=1 Tax=Frankia sp. AiPa1 TaxID=573492 RepID=UPI00202AEB11|nr:2,3-diaminopropionate biosynthesis protein SbnA [Frankia sp. AiPa1]